MSAFKPATIVIEGKVPHLGLIVAEFKGHVDPGDASVQAKNKLMILRDWPHVYDIVSKSIGVVLFFGIGPAHLLIGIVSVVPFGLVNTSVPQKAKDVLVEPVLLLI